MDSDIKNFIREENEKLAGMIAGGFAEVHKKFEEVDKKFLELEDKMNNRFDAVDERLDRIAKSHEYRITSLERDVAELKT